MMRSRALDSSFTPLRRRTLAASVGVVGSLLGLGLAVGLQACSSDAATTGGKRVTLHTRVQGDPAAATEFETAFGWKVTLTKAAVSAGPFYYFDGVPPLVLRHEPRPWRYAVRLLGLGIAHAHPGHYVPGNAMGQMLESSSLDLLGDPVDFPDGEGVSGVYRSARFTLSKPSGPLAGELAGHVALAEGVAEKDGEAPRYFRAFADLAAVEKSAAKGRVEGCELSEADVQGDGTITVQVNPRIWFDLVDFSEAEEASAEAPAELPEDSQPRIAFALGVAQLSAYEFAYKSP